jgi:hypothetical protein
VTGQCESGAGRMDARLTWRLKARRQLADLTCSQFNGWTAAQQVLRKTLRESVAAQIRVEYRTALSLPVYVGFTRKYINMAACFLACNEFYNKCLQYGRTLMQTSLLDVKWLITWPTDYFSVQAVFPLPHGAVKECEQWRKDCQWS